MGERTTENDLEEINGIKSRKKLVNLTFLSMKINQMIDVFVRDCCYELMMVINRKLHKFSLYLLPFFVLNLVELSSSRNTY